VFVMDYDSKQWIKAEEAAYVKSERIQTPMAGGIVAFGQKPRAEGVSSQVQGQVITFEDLFK
jgi:copper chaperone NosL